MRNGGGLCRGNVRLTRVWLGVPISGESNRVEVSFSLDAVMFRKTGETFIKRC